MKPEAQRIAIAEACGWKPTTDGGICWNSEGEPIVTPPDYLNDLNAMHEVLNMLSDDENAEIWAQLKAIVTNTVTNGNLNRVIPAWRVAKASAAEWSEAFLRARGLWISQN